MHVRLWDIATGRAVQSFMAQPAGTPDPAKPRGAQSSVTAARSGAISSDASKVVEFLGRNGYVFDTATGKELVKIEQQGGPGDSVAISSDSRYLLYSAVGRTQRVPLANSVASRPATSHPIALCNLVDGKVVTQLEMDGGGTGPSAFSPDGQMVAVTSVDNQFRCELRKVPDLSQINVIDLPSRPSAVEFSHSGKLLATSVANGTILVWDLDHLPERTRP